MPTTLNKISEQIHRIHYGGNPSDDSEISLTEVKELVIQATNRLLKVEHGNMRASLKEHFPPHHLIATYEGVPVAPAYDPTVGINCTAISGTISATEIVVTRLTSNPDTYTITINGLSLTDITAAELQAAISGASTSCVLSLGVDTGNPENFLIAGISDLVVTDTDLTFTYVPVLDNQAWLLSNGGWLIDDQFYWIISEGDNTETTVPQVILDYVDETHTLLDTTVTEDTYAVTLDGMSICCLTSDETSIKAEATLPAMPITETKGIGVWRVYPPNQPESEFIPVSSQHLGRIGNIVHNNMSSVFSNISAYEWKDYYTIRFNQPASVIGTPVTIQLLVHDYSKISGDAILPIPADMEHQVQEIVLQHLANKGPIDRQNDELDMP